MTKEIVFKNLLNISAFASFETSSDGHWNQYKVGSPLDGYLFSDRFSIHTDLEDDPFILIDLNEEYCVEKVNILLRDQYSEKILPLRVSASIDGEAWITIGEIHLVLLSSDFLTAKIVNSIRYIKIEHAGYGYLYLSSVNIYVSQKNFIPVMNKHYDKNTDRFIVSHSPFYGLGGRLAVLASSLGYLPHSTNKTILVKWKDNSAKNLLSFPRQIDYEGVYKKSLNRNLSETLKCHLYNLPKQANSERGLSYRTPPKPDAREKAITFITRDSFIPYENESFLSCMRRVYSNIIPSKEVFESVEVLETEFGLNDDVYKKSLGIHIRHGNGERYQNKTNHQWGVKPPARQKILASIKHALLKASPKIETIVICSDCKAMEKTIEDAFYNHCNIVFISKNIQNIGAGCNHTQDVFNKNEARNYVDLEMDELVTFAEILVLSKCGSICGGNSFYFSAVLGFSQCDETAITDIDNSDRYLKIDNNLKPLNDFENNKIVDEITSQLQSNGIMLDGIFANKDIRLDDVSLFYFDELIFQGDLAMLSSATSSGKNLHKKL